MTKHEVEKALAPYVHAYVNFRCSQEIGGVYYPTNRKDIWANLYETTMSFLTLVIMARHASNRREKLESVKHVHLLVGRIPVITGACLTLD